MEGTKENNIFVRPVYVLLFAIISTALWGSAIPAIKIGYELFAIDAGDVPTKFVFAGYRFVLAGIMVTLFSCISRKSLVLPQKKDIKGIVLLGLVQTTVEYIFFYLSLIKLSGVKGSILNSIGNFFAVLLAHFMFKNDRLNVQKAIGCILGFAGVVVCNFENGLDMTFSLTGEGFILIAAFCFALGSVITKVITQKSDSVMITGYQLALGGAVLAAIGLAMGGSLHFLSVRAVLMLFYLAMLSAVAFSLWAQLLKYNPVGKISVYCFLNPVFGVILSGIMLGEDIFNVKSLMALVLVSVGIYVVNKK